MSETCQRFGLLELVARRRQLRLRLSERRTRLLRVTHHAGGRLVGGGAPLRATLCWVSLILSPLCARHELARLRTLDGRGRCCRGRRWRGRRWRGRRWRRRALRLLQCGELPLPVGRRFAKLLGSLFLARELCFKLS